jgi:hypothetical protein
MALVDAWFAFSMIAALCALFMAVFLHMFARAFSLQQLNMWVKSEYAQVAATFLIILSVLSMQTVGQSIAADVALAVAQSSGNFALTGSIPPGAGGLKDVNLLAKKYVLNVLDCEKNIYALVYLMNYPIENAMSRSIDITGGEAVSGGFALSGRVTLAHYIEHQLVYLGVFHLVQYNVLLFAQYTMLPIFLPLGIVLRAFPITRGTGNLIAAFAIGFAFVYPITYVLIVASAPHTAGLCKTVEIDLAKASKDRVTPCFNNEGAVMENMYKVQKDTPVLAAIWNFFADTLSAIYMQARFYPLIALIITFTFIRQASSIMGADLSEIGRGLIKLI